MISPLARLLWLLALLSMLNGCKRQSEPHVEFSGQVISGGKPLRVKWGENLKVLFCTVDQQNKPGEKSYMAISDRRGYFTASAPPGKYRIAVLLLHRDKDILHNAFDSIRSPFVRDLHEGDTLNLDLDHPTH